MTFSVYWTQKNKYLIKIKDVRSKILIKILSQYFETSTKKLNNFLSMPYYIFLTYIYTVKNIGKFSDYVLGNFS